MRYLHFALLLFATQTLSAQSSWSAGLELQAYPTGFMPGIRIEKAMTPHDALHLRLGYNMANHGDNGVQDDERGGGFGGSLGYRYYFQSGQKGWCLGPRADVWCNRMDWKSLDAAGQTLASGTTRITVVQPTLEAGYQFRPGNSKLFVTPTLAFGYEVNVVTAGREVGQGAIFLLGIVVGMEW
ncbi:MAG: hypothetical protein IPL65_14870 [Lewinellaceae bacterium]|nr:hypothetical protein [Lewinellaceae bacterium]